MRKGIAFVISGPSGTGKTTLIRELRTRVEGIGFSVSHTTRSPRQGEASGVNYHFVDRSTFESMQVEGAFAEWAEVHGSLYGTSFAALEALTSQSLDVVLDIDVQGALQIAARLQGVVLIFILPPSWHELQRRIRDRGLDVPEAMERRMKAARSEISQAGHYDYLLANRDVEEASQELVSIVRAERCRTWQRQHELRTLIRPTG